MSAMSAAGETDISHNTNEPTAGNKSPKTMPPNLVEFIEKIIVVRGQTELPFVLGIFLQRPIGR
jgi:hypothetical protein